jgi:hypothetical protein
MEVIDHRLTEANATSQYIKVGATKWKEGMAGLALSGKDGALGLVTTVQTEHVDDYLDMPIEKVTSAHVVSLVAGRQSPGDPGMLAWWHDPNDPATLDAVQSPFNDDLHYIKPVKLWMQWPKGYGISEMDWASLDGLPGSYATGTTLVRPRYQWMNDEGVLAQFAEQGFVKPGEPVEHRFDIGPISEVALPGDGFNPAVLRPDGKVVRVDAFSKQVTEAPTVPGASAIAFVGDDQMLAVAGRNGISMFGEKGAAASVKLGAPLTSMAYDDTTQRLAGIDASGRITLTDGALKALPAVQVSLAMLDGRGAPRITNGRAGEFLVHRAGGAKVAAIRFAGSEVRFAARTLEGVRGVARVAGDERGHVFVALDGKQAEFGLDGSRVMRAEQAGRAGTVLAISRSFKGESRLLADVKFR